MVISCTFGWFDSAVLLGSGAWSLLFRFLHSIWHTGTTSTNLHYASQCQALWDNIHYAVDALQACVVFLCGVLQKYNILDAYWLGATCLSFLLSKLFLLHSKLASCSYMWKKWRYRFLLILDMVNVFYVLVAPAILTAFVIFTSVSVSILWFVCYSSQTQWF